MNWRVLTMLRPKNKTWQAKNLSLTQPGGAEEEKATSADREEQTAALRQKQETYSCRLVSLLLHLRSQRSGRVWELGAPLEHLLQERHVRRLGKHVRPSDLEVVVDKELLFG